MKFSVTEDGTPETERTFGMSSSEVPGGAWTHVAVTRQGGTLKLWARVAGGGAQKSSTHGFGGAVFVSTSPVKIGRGFIGMIDELRLSAVNREGAFCRVQFRYQHNSANQLLTERIGTPTQSGSHANLSVDNATSGATERRYAYDADGNNTVITEYARTGIVNGATGVRIVGESMTYDVLGRQTKWHGYTATEHTIHQATGWKRAETIAPGAGPRGHLNTSTYYVYDGDDVAMDLSGNLSRGRKNDGTPRSGWNVSRHYATPFLDENVSVTTYATKHLPGWGLTNGRADYDPEEGVVKHTRINTISTSSTQLPSGHPLSAVTMPSTFYYTHDGLGSVRTLTAHNLNQIASAPVFPASPSTAPPRATGIASHYDYLAFGESHNLSTQSLFNNRYGYTGRELRPSANDLFYRHRNYQPWSGRFASRDPLGLSAGVNVYAYVENNPAIRIDPMGLDWRWDAASRTWVKVPNTYHRPMPLSPGRHDGEVSKGRDPATSKTIPWSENEIQEYRNQMNWLVRFIWGEIDSDAGFMMYENALWHDHQNRSRFIPRSSDEAWRRSIVAAGTGLGEGYRFSYNLSTAGTFNLAVAVDEATQPGMYREDAQKVLWDAAADQLVMTAAYYAGGKLFDTLKNPQVKSNSSSAPQKTQVPRVRHHTSPEGARSIMKDQAINPSRADIPGRAGVHVETEPFGPARTAAQETGASRGGAYVEFDAPRRMNPTKVGPRNTSVIPANEPLPIDDLNPTVTTQPWWQSWGRE